MLASCLPCDHAVEAAAASVKIAQQIKRFTFVSSDGQGTTAGALPNLGQRLRPPRPSLGRAAPIQLAAMNDQNFGAGSADGSTFSQRMPKRPRIVSSLLRKSPSRLPF